MFSIFLIFITELIAFRWGTAKLASIGISHDPHGHNVGGLAAHGPESPGPDMHTHGVEEQAGFSAIEEQGTVDSYEKKNVDGSGKDVEARVNISSYDSAIDTAATQIIGVAILEFGVLLHRCVA